MSVKNLEFYGNESVPSEEITEAINDEIAHAPKAPGELIERLRVHNSSSPKDAGGDIDADWEEVNTSGEESFAGGNPTPDQSDVEENAHAMGINFEDNEPLDFVKKIETRDEHRWELEENSKQKGDLI